MTPETPAEGIMMTGDYGNSKWYKVVCGCGNPDHNIDFEVEADETGVTVNTYVTTKTDYWGETFPRRRDINSDILQEFDWFWKDVVNGLVRRVKWTWAIWTRGYIKTETTISMTEQQALNYAETLKSAAQDVVQFRHPNK